ncbi:transglutaminase family protein [Thalassotalea montiporae]
MLDSIVKTNPNKRPKNLAQLLNEKRVNFSVFDFKNRSGAEHYQLSLLNCWLLLLVQTLTLALFVTELTTWMLALIALSLLWQVARISTAKHQASRLTRGQGRQGKIQATPRLIVALFALTGAGIIILNGQSLGLLSSMVHLICFAYAIKAFEIRKRADFFQLILIGLFLHACALIFTQNIWFAALVVMLVTLNFALLYRVFASAIGIPIAYRETGKLLLLSIPLAVALFVFFPRLSPFWQVPLANTAKTGLGSDVRPGDIAKLALSDELAFRVQFEGAIPAKTQMYWRAMTMPFYNGQRWSRSQNNKPPLYLASEPEYQISSDDRRAYTYQVMAEQSNQHWLFALDTALAPGNDARQLNDFSLINNQPLTKTKSYQVTSFPNAIREPEMSEAFQRFYKRIPDDANPQLQALGRELAAQYQNPQALINHVLAQFREQAYFYTLSPPLLSNNSLDQFYFDTRSGFCEHYASSFAFLMRSAGIPARLVTGYLGGERNEQGNYYAIYQYDAHAWTEVWLEGRGWVAVDPTSAVSPDRVSDNMADALREQRINLAGAFSWQAFSSAAWLANIRMQIEAIDYQWNRLVLSYSVDKQSRFLRELLGSGSFWKSTAIVMSVFLLMFLLLWLRGVYQQPSVKLPRWQRQFNKLLVKLAEQGVERAPHQVPNSLVPLIAAHHNEASILFAKLCQLHDLLRYQTLSHDEFKTQEKLFIQTCRECNKTLG